MTYKVRDPIEVQGIVDGKPAEADGKPVMVKHYYVTFYGGEPKQGEHGDPYIEVWADGSISANYPIPGIENRIWLYDDQWVGVIEGVKRAMEDKKEEIRRKREQWFLENGDKKEHWGYEVTWSINDARKLLSSAPMRWGKEDYWKHRTAEVQIDGKWLHLCRTDLADDVCTYGGHDFQEELDGLREKYLRGIGYGARLTESGDGFAVVDSFSDG